MTRENFQKKTRKTDTDYDTFIRELSVLLYAGYPYNGLGLFSIEGNGGSGSISEAAFRQLLIPSERLRSDFPELRETEAGKPVEDQDTLKKYMEAVLDYNKDTSKVTASGMKYSDITGTAFYKAAFCAVYCNNLSDGRVMYEKTYLNESPYESTRNAIWQLMYEYGIPGNTGMSLSDKSRELLNKAKSGISILSAEPTSEQIGSVKIAGDTTFSKETDGKWYTGELHVEEPANFHGAYTITLPEGTSLYEGSTLVKAGEPFRLVSEKKPEGAEKVTVSAKIPWLKSVKMYSPVKNVAGQEVTASDGKSFQHMVGAEIGTADVGASVDLKASTETPNPSNPPSTTDPSNPVNPSNPSTPTDPSTPVTPPNPVNPNGPSIPPNQENTSASEEPSSPEHTVSRETPAANQPAASKKPTAVKKSDGNGKQKVSASVLPKTGDSSHVMLWGLGLIGCGAAALGLLTLRIRNRREE
ncbi:LPXTG-motif cell wall anchor domain-containing protein [Eubacterium pyruvativorans]|uniref:LPXTG-motif cell wall anchor domain-containing protein n=1 Tax=Eubacterium pyruvativorans TaxID=155865 RepID=A0A1I7FFU2_9FIRM|nr:LPXTG cell wall anchor domain-containing protein [Eubacterium pyruvativorans]SFN84094.1 LPXTG-motif cell wall anchor domain-containing protein [Eubacterium pyruvativorans]SFU35073.1 LPXTG-motif cell wall anchor domain-containing protein [Eubacterium pyruvativorans]